MPVSALLGGRRGARASHKTANVSRLAPVIQQSKAQACAELLEQMRNTGQLPTSTRRTTPKRGTQTRRERDGGMAKNGALGTPLREAHR